MTEWETKCQRPTWHFPLGVVGNRRLMLEAETAMNPAIFFEYWSPPVQRNGTWYSNPPGYDAGFITSSERIGVERTHRDMLRNMTDRARKLIWC